MSDIPRDASTSLSEAEAERHERIARAAYLRAEAHGFEGDRHLDDWLEAEREIDALWSVLPQLWFRNTWSWSAETSKPRIDRATPACLAAHHPQLGVLHFYSELAPRETLFTENETNVRRHWNDQAAIGFELE